MHSFLRLATFLVFSTTLTFAQPPQPTFNDLLADHLVGNWILQGTIAGKQTTHDVAAEWVLNHQYVQIHEVSREKNERGQPTYEAKVFVGWDQSSGEYICVWLDVWGGISAASIGRAKPSGDEIRFLFKDKDTFHTTFAYDKAAGTWEWRMDSEENGSLKPFARVKLTKK